MRTWLNLRRWSGCVVSMNLAGITVAEDHIRIGAMTTHAQIAADGRLTGNAAVVRDAAGQIAHPAIRNMGTIGGSVCHADPNADFPGALVAANVALEAVGPARRKADSGR